MSADMPGEPRVELIGSAMHALVGAVPELAGRTGNPVIVVGGLAVLCRLGTAYRATSDLDTVHRRGSGDLPILEVLLTTGVEKSGPAGALLPTPAGLVQVDIIEVTDSELERLPDDPTDRLAVLSHDWGARSATLMRISAAGSPVDSGVEVVVRVAEPGPLVAMKLQSVMNRTTAKERTDLLDIIRLTTDPVAGPQAREQLRAAPTS
jgi:hypothetical protein